MATEHRFRPEHGPERTATWCQEAHRDRDRRSPHHHERLTATVRASSSVAPGACASQNIPKMPRAEHAATQKTTRHKGRRDRIGSSAARASRWQCMSSARHCSKPMRHPRGTSEPDHVSPRRIGNPAWIGSVSRRSSAKIAPATRRPLTGKQKDNGLLEVVVDRSDPPDGRRKWSRNLSSARTISAPLFAAFRAHAAHGDARCRRALEGRRVR